MATGAMPPGGLHAPPPGGLHEFGPGGISQSDDLTERLLTQADFDIFPQKGGGARVSQSRSVANVRLGKGASVSSYAWTLPTKPGGSTTVVNNGTTVTADYLPDTAGTYIIQCVVTFSDSTTVTKQDAYVSA